MNHFFRFNAIAAVALALISPVLAKTGSQSRPLNEDAALELLQRTLKRDQVYGERISLALLRLQHRRDYEDLF